MTQLQELFEAEGTTSAIDCISGLRLSSAEFRTAFFRVRDTLMQCPVSKQAPSIKHDKPEAATSKTETPKTTPVVKESEAPKSTPTVKESEKPKSTPVVKESKETKSNIDFNGFDEFIIESYVSDEKSDINIYDLLRSYRICRRKDNLTPPVYAAYRRYLSSIFKMDADMIKGLKPKLNPELRIENSEYGKIYRHPYYTDIWCSEDGIFYYRGPSGELIERTPAIYCGNYTISVSGSETNPSASARRIALECFLQKKLPARSYVFHKNGNKKDFRFCNLCIKGMEDYIKQEKNYCKSDVLATCEYIVAHNKDISNIENDTNFRIGWNFAKNILDKKTYRDISDRYF
jgi:hypothetical protein